jgi:hypothetical protein
MPVMLEIKQGKKVAVGFDDNIGAVSSVTAVGYALALVSVAVKTVAALAAVARGYINFGAVNEHFLRA